MHCCHNTFSVIYVSIYVCSFRFIHLNLWLKYLHLGIYYLQIPAICGLISKKKKKNSFNLVLSKHCHNKCKKKASEAAISWLLVPTIDQSPKTLQLFISHNTSRWRHFIRWRLLRYVTFNKNLQSQVTSHQASGLPLIKKETLNPPLFDG